MRLTEQKLRQIINEETTHLRKGRSLREYGASTSSLRGGWPDEPDEEHEYGQKHMMLTNAQQSVEAAMKALDDAIDYERESGDPDYADELYSLYVDLNVVNSELEAHVDAVLAMVDMSGSPR